MLGSLNALVHSDIAYFIEGRRQMIPFEYILAYDIDFDETKIRFWKDHGDIRVSRRWAMPEFANGDQLLAWLNRIIDEFKEQTQTEYELGKEKTEGYIKGGSRASE